MEPVQNWPVNAPRPPAALRGTITVPLGRCSCTSREVAKPHRVGTGIFDVVRQRIERVIVPARIARRDAQPGARPRADASSRPCAEIARAFGAARARLPAARSRPDAGATPNAADAYRRNGATATIASDNSQHCAVRSPIDWRRRQPPQWNRDFEATRLCCCAMTDSALADPLAWRPLKAPSLAEFEVIATEAFRRLPQRSAPSAKAW